MISEVLTDRPAWIVIHADKNGQPGKMIGRQPVPAGRSENVVVTLAVMSATRHLHVLLYQDVGTPRVFEPELDVLIFQNGKPVSAEFDQIVQ